MVASCHAPRSLYGLKHLPLVLALFLLLVGGAQGALPAVGCCTATLVAAQNPGCTALASSVPNDANDCSSISDVVTSFSVNLPTLAAGYAIDLCSPNVTSYSRVPWRCNLATGRVTSLTFAAAGSIPVSIGGLQALTLLASGTDIALVGTIPNSVGQLTNLQVLSFGGSYYYASQLSGTLPSSIYALTALRVIDLSGNILSGTLPPYFFAGMTSLMSVDLHGGNNFTGPLPSALLSLPNITHVDLGQNSFTGSLPATNAPNLQYLNARDNSFSGSLSPAFLAGVTGLKGLYLDNNQLSGTLPDLSVLTALSSLPAPTFQTDVAGVTFRPNAFQVQTSNIGGGSLGYTPFLDLSRNLFTGAVNASQLPFGGQVHTSFKGTDLSNNQLSFANFSCNNAAVAASLFSTTILHPQAGFGVTGDTVTVTNFSALSAYLSLQSASGSNACTGGTTTIILTANLTFTSAIVIGGDPYLTQGYTRDPVAYTYGPYGKGYTSYTSGYPMQSVWYDDSFYNNQFTGTACNVSGSYSQGFKCLLSASRSITIVGACSPGPCVLDAQGLGRHFEVYASGLRLQNLKLINGVSPTDASGNYLQYQVSVGSYQPTTLWGGGSIFADASSVVEVDNCIFTANAANGVPGGGAIASLAMNPLSVTAVNSSFLNNNAINGQGGAIFTRGGAVLLKSVFNTNLANVGGAVTAVMGVTATGCTFINNIAYTTGGGAVAVPLVTTTYTGLAYYRPRLIDRWLPPRIQPDSAFAGTYFGYNSATSTTGVGGAVFAPTGTFVGLTQCTFEYNAASLAGGALYGDGVTDQQSRFTGNGISGSGVLDACSSAGGGALAVSGGRGLALNGTAFIMNTGQTQGGAILALYASPFNNGGLFLGVPTYATVNLTNVVLTNNQVVSGGGGAMVLSNSIATLTNVTCSNNGAFHGVGGCLNALQLGGLTINGGSVFSSNTATAGGAVGVTCGISCAATTWACGGTNLPAVVVSISQTMFYSNFATSQGGALYVRGGGLVLNQTNITTNAASGVVGQGGGVFVAEYWNGQPSTPIALAQSGVRILNTSFVHNIAYASPASSIPSELFSGTAAPGAGGGLFFSSTYSLAPLVATAGTSWASNYANDGAGAYVYGSAALTLSGASFASNVAYNSGGALKLSNPTVSTAMVATLTSSTFSLNNAYKLGGAVSIAANVSLADSGSTFANNSANNGGAFSLSSPQRTTQVSLTGTSTIGNMAYTAGGLFFTDAANASFAPVTACIPANCSGNIAPNGANTLVAQPASFTCSLNSTSLVVKSGQALPVFGISLYDSLGNLVIEAPDVVATLNTNNNNLAGTTAAQYRNGSATFMALTVTGFPNTSATLAYTISSASLALVNGLSGSFTVQLSQCGALEIFDPSQLKCVCAAGAAQNLVTYTCTLCPPGQYAPSTGSASCLLNTPGYYSSADRTQQIACPVGTFLNATSLACSRCPLGTYASTSGQTSCSTNTPGYYSSTDRTNQIPCPVGTFLNGTSLACSPCALGTFTSLAGQTTCQVNPAGEVSSPQTTLSSSLTLGGITASSFGSAQNATLAASIARTLNLTSSSIVSVTSVTTTSTRRRLEATAALVNFTVTVTGNSANSALNNLISTTGSNYPAVFAQALATSLAQSNDPVLRTIAPSAITASVPISSTVYLQAEPCQPGTYLNGVNQTCDPCAVGTVAPTASSITCTVCPARTAWINASVACQPCPDNAVTSPNTAKQCACSIGFYDTLFGASLASPVCAPCPLGGVCTTGLLAADTDWWRASTVSDVLYKCKVGNCMQEIVEGPLTSNAGKVNITITGNSTDPTNCVEGNTGPLCALCLPGYALQSGECKPCPPGDAFAAWQPGSKAALILLCVLAGLAFIAVAFFQPLSPRLEASWSAVTGAIGMAFGKITSLPKKCLACCVPALRQNTSRLNSARLSSARPSIGKVPSMKLSETAVAPRTSAPRVSELLAEAKSIDAPAHHVTTSAEAAAAVQEARKSAVAAMMASMEGEGVALASAATQRLSSMVGVDLPGGDGEGDELGEEEGDDFYGATGEALELLEKARRLAEKAQKYGKIVINFYQIVSTFIRSLDIPWPHVFITTMGKISIINLNLVRLPKAACLSPEPSYYDEFNGYTLGLLFALIFIGVFWAFGRHILAPVTLAGMSAEDAAERRSQFSSTCLQRTLMLLYLVYPGVSVAIFGMFSCSTVSGHSYLDQDFRITCYDKTHYRYVGGAIVWLFLVPIGVPVFFNWLLKRFRVPDMAALVEDNAWLREAAEHAWRLGMPQPGGVDVKTLCCDTIGDNHLAMLHAVLLHDADADTAANIFAGQVPKGRSAALQQEQKAAKGKEAAEAETPSLFMRVIHRITALRERIAGLLNPVTKLEHITAGDEERATQLKQLLLWCRHAGVLSIGSLVWYGDLGLPEPPPETEGDAAPVKLPPPHWTGIRSHEVPELLKRASVECGFLFSVYTTRCWYWESVELLRKLILTSILALISPGSAGQVVVGALVALFALLANIKLKPFSEASLNFVNQTAQLNLFLFLWVALLLKVNLDGDGSAAFFTGIVVFLSVVPIALPFGLQAYIRLGGLSHENTIDARELAKDAVLETEG